MNVHKWPPTIFGHFRPKSDVLYGHSLNWFNSLFIYFYFLGEEGEDNCDYVAVFLTSRLQGDLDVKYDFSVLKSDNTCWGRIGNTFKKFCPDQNSWGYGKAFSKAKLMEKQNELLPNGCLTIVCNLEIFYSDKTTQGRVSERMSYEEWPSLSSVYIPYFRPILDSIQRWLMGKQARKGFRPTSVM